MRNTYNDIFGLQTQRLQLRVLDESHGKEVVDYLIRNKTFHKPFTPKRTKHFYSVEFHKATLRRSYERFIRQSSIRFYLSTNEEPEKIIGDMVFENIIKGIFLSCFLGYQMDSNYINKGYMTEALQTAIDYIFDEVGLHRIEANIMPVNLSSIRVAEKLGFNNEGLAIKYLKINGKWEDHYHFVKLNPKLE